MSINDFRGEYAFLSNFCPCEIVYEGMKFQSTEAAYQAAKTVDIKEREKFIYLGPGEAKRLGRSVKLRPDWEKIKLSVMENLLRQKFSDKKLQERLFATGNEMLIEGNWWNDTYWGVCRGKGENHLGKLLMKIRSEIRASGANNGK